MQFLVGLAVGALAAALYYSEQAREEAQARLANAQVSLQQARQSAASAVAGGAQKLGGAIDAAQLPAQVKDAAGRATSTIRSTAGSLGQGPADGDRGEGGTPPTS
jgi:hypothetical protein